MSTYYQEHEIFIQSVRRFIAQELDPYVDQWEKEGYYPDEVFRKLGEQGFLGILIPEEYGGIGGDYHLAGAWCEVFGELRSVGLTVGVNMHSVVSGYAIALYGTEEQKKKWLPGIVSGETIAAYAFTEPGAGSDLASLQSKAILDGNQWTLNGSKTFITNGARADVILVLARTNPDAGYKGFTTFLVDANSAGYTVTRTLDKLGWHASDTAELAFEDLKLEENTVLGTPGEGWIQASKSLSWERMMLTLTALGGARACFRDCFRYTGERIAFGKPIRELEVINHTLREMRSRILRGEAYCHKLLTELCEGKELRGDMAMAKRLVCDDLVWLADQAIQIHGGYGYTSEFSAERWWRDLRLMPIGGGTREIMAELAAKELKLH